MSTKELLNKIISFLENNDLIMDKNSNCTKQYEFWPKDDNLRRSYVLNEICAGEDGTNIYYVITVYEWGIIKQILYATRAIRTTHTEEEIDTTLNSFIEREKRTGDLNKQYKGQYYNCFDIGDDEKDPDNCFLCGYITYVFDNYIDNYGNITVIAQCADFITDDKVIVHLGIGPGDSDIISEEEYKMQKRRYYQMKINILQEEMNKI
jgi:hypothetical protein